MSFAVDASAPAEYGQSMLGGRAFFTASRNE